jgi:prepilin-type N-terminal cleavage/methylation domain-containing protein
MKSRGFTLIELVVVMGIIAVLASVLLPALSAARARSGETVCASNLRQIGLAMDLYKEAEGEYPPVENKAISPYLSSAKLRCPVVLNEDAFNFSVYKNLAIFSNKWTDPLVGAHVKAVTECFEKRGPEFPLLVDKHHLPKILRADNQLYGIALVYRASGAVDRVPKAKVAKLILAQGGAEPANDLPCDLAAQDANL